MSPLARCLWVVALAAASAVAAGGQQVTYIDRLRVPVLQDDIGFGQAVTVDAATSEIFICDTRTNRILIFDQEGYFTFRILGGELFSSPLDLAVDPEGLLLVLASRGGRRLPVELDFDGVFRRELPLRGIGEGLRTPLLVSIALSPNGQRIYLVDEANKRLWITDRQGQAQSSVDLREGVAEDRRQDLSLGQVDVYGEHVLVARSSEGQILRLDLDGNLVDEVGIKGGTPCQLGWPTAAALTDQGEILVLDQQRMVLSRWSAQSRRCLSEHIGIGAAPGFLYYPFDLALDRHGRFYIAQSFEGRVQVYEGLGSAPEAPATAAAPPDDGGR